MIVKKTGYLLLMLVSLMMSACAVPLQEEQVTVFELERQASKAYVDKNWKLAEKKYSELISLAPGTAEIWFRLANIYAHTQKPEKAISAYREAVIRRPDYGKAWYNMALISLQQTTSLHIEMLKHLEPGSKHYRLAKQTAESLVRVLEQRRAVSKGYTDKAEER